MPVPLQKLGIGVKKNPQAVVVMVHPVSGWLKLYKLTVSPASTSVSLLNASMVNVASSVLDCASSTATGRSLTQKTVNDPVATADNHPTLSTDR